MKLDQLRPLKLSKTITHAFLFLVVGFLYAAEPEITKIKSSVSGVDQAVKAVYVSAEEKNSSPTLPNLVFKPDLASIEIEAIDRLNAIDRRNFSDMKQILNHLKETRTQLNWKLDPETKDERVDQFISFLDWYAKNIPPSNAEFDIRVQRTIGMALVIAQPAMKDHIKANLLSQVIDRPQLSIEEQHKLLNGAFKALGLGEVNPWSGMESTLLSLESILSPEALAEKEKNPNTPLAVLIGKKIDAGDFTWKGPAFEKFAQALQSEMGISILSLISAGKVPPDEISDFARLLNEKRKALELPNELKPLPKSHVFETTDPEKLEERLRKLFNSQAKKGILASTVMSNDKQFISTLNKIKRNQTGVLEDFKIQIPKTDPKRDELISSPCENIFQQLF